MITRSRITGIIRLIGIPLVVALLAASAVARAYDPLNEISATSRTFDLTVRDASRSREIPIRVYLSDDVKSAPVVLFSHGLGGSREGSSYLGRHWAQRGYAAVFLQHPGSDDSVWKDTRPLLRKRALKRAASFENFQLRAEDVKAVLNQLTAWSNDANERLYNRLDLKRVGMSGHSFGAVTTQALSGQNFALGKSFTDTRILAAVVMSPSAPRRKKSTDNAFGGVTIPWLLMTGTLDDAPIGDIDAASRLEVFPALPPRDKYELVLFDAEHFAFTDSLGVDKTHQRNPNHHRVILALSTAFWDAYLRGDTAAKDWLQGDGARTVLDAKDGWRKK